MGYVTFVGAGPYDASYLTLAGKKALEEADCVLYDHLLDPSMLTFTNGECIYVGKRGHHPSMKQSDIQTLLLEKAKQYKHVVRLKGGDSFVFGRGGEEGLALQKEGIPFQFIPGITSAIAVAEHVGIPITHRGLATGFLVLTAHSQDHDLPISIEQVKNTKITLVFLMGNSRISQIIELLLQAGRSNQTPMAIISNGCSPKQHVLVGTLTTIEEKMKKTPPIAPSILVVGDVVSLYPSLCPPIQPLQHKTIAVYKVNDEVSPLTSLLKAQGAHVIEYQSGTIEYLPTSFDMLTSYQGYIFTSKHAIHAFFHTLRQQKKDIRELAHKRFLVIGSKCGEVLAEYGIFADSIGNGTKLDVRQSFALRKEEKLLYLCGDLAKELNVEPYTYDQQVLYRNKKVAQTIPHVDYDAICLTCASSVFRCPLDLTETLCVAIGKTTGEALQKKGCKKYRIAKKTTYEAMLEVLLEEEIKCIVEED